MVIVTRVAKTALEKALAENEDMDGSDPVSRNLPVEGNLRQPLIVKVDST